MKLKERSARIRVYVFSQRQLKVHLAQLIEMDKNTDGERWSEMHFFFEVPGKWHYSRLLKDRAGNAVGFGVASLKSEGLHLHRIVIASSHQGRGLGRRLICEIGRAAQRHGVEQVTLKVALHNTPAIAFYEKLGFRVRGQTKLNLIMGCNVTSLLKMQERKTTKPYVSIQRQDDNCHCPTLG